MSNWLTKIINRKNLRKLEKESKIDDGRPVKWVEESHNMWRIVYADQDGKENNANDKGLKNGKEVTIPKGRFAGKSAAMPNDGNSEDAGEFDF